MREEEFTSLQSALDRYDSAASSAEEARVEVRRLFGGLRPETEASEEMRAVHKQLLETVRRADLAAQLARGLLGVVAAIQGLNQPAPATNVPYSPPEGEDYVGT
jgi:hypothetical protein